MYRVVAISNDPTEAEAQLNAQLADGFVFVAWLGVPTVLNPTNAIFYQAETPS